MKQIKVENLYFSYTDEFIFEDIGFTLSQKDGCVLLAGENGAGKSTLINVVCGLLEEDGGSIERDTMRIAYLPFEMPLYPHLTILENLRYFYRSFRGKDFRENDEEVKRVLQVLSIDYLHQRFDKCSSGQQQKAGIAMILLSGADMIIMDEPFVAIDAKSVQRLIEYIQSMKQETLFLITSHTTAELQAITDHVLYLKDKKLQHIYEKEEVMDFFHGYGHEH